MTPDSCISSIRSFPSRVRSPTPEKTEPPPCWSATLVISSAIIPEVLLHLRDQLARAAVLGDVHAERVKDLGQPVREDGVEHDALDLDDLPRVLAVALVGH